MTARFERRVREAEIRAKIVKTWRNARDFAAQTFSRWLKDTWRDETRFDAWAVWAKLKKEGVFVRVSGYGPGTIYAPMKCATCITRTEKYKRLADLLREAAGLVADLERTEGRHA